MKQQQLLLRDSNNNPLEAQEREANADILSSVQPPEKELCDVFNINQYVHSIITLLKGKLFLEDSVLSLK